MIPKEKRSSVEFRLYKKSDFPMIRKWWIKHNHKIIKENLLSDTGVVVEKNGEALAAGWAYLSNSKLAQIGWIVSNPDCKPKEKVIAVYDVMECLEKMLKDQGYETIQMISDHSALTKMAISDGYIKIHQHDVVVKEL